jgi:hypothetical protein
MRDAKPFASLSSGLLARKGAAKPAMRPQGFGSFGSSLEDLGWNDMGQPSEAPVAYDHVPSSIESLTPAAGGRFRAEPPQVVEQRRQLEEAFTPEPVAEPVPAPVIQAVAEPEPQPEPTPEPKVSAPVVRLPRRRAAPAPKPVAAALPARAKAAFTLRLDPDRHLKLRLACALSRRSAQQLVTGALDDFLNSLPEVEAMTDRLPAEAGHRSR